MKALLSLWSADLLALRDAIEEVEDVADGFHVDVMDGRFVRHLLFGPDVVRAIRHQTNKLLDAHLMVDEVDLWLEPFVEAGADLLTVHLQSTPDLARTIERIRSLGARPSVALRLDEPIARICPVVDMVDRILLLGTDVGIKGASIEPALYERIRRVQKLLKRSSSSPEIFVDGGIRPESVPLIASTGADGVIPGSLVFAHESPREMVRWVQKQGLRPRPIPPVGEEAQRPTGHGYMRESPGAAK